MNKTARTLKVLCLASLFVGLATAIAGIYCSVTNQGIPAFAATAAAVLTFAFGVRGAVLANVPSNAPKVLTFSVVVFVIALAAAVYVTLTTSVSLESICLYFDACVLALTAVQARRLKRELERA